jgi:hypothetical protein
VVVVAVVVVRILVVVVVAEVVVVATVVAVVRSLNVTCSPSPVHGIVNVWDATTTQPHRRQ